jgi:hypothetical protein
MGEHRVVCDAHLLAAERACTQLVADYRDLEQMLAPSLGVWGDGQVLASGNWGERAVLVEWVQALQRDIWWVATTWAEVLADVCSLSWTLGRVREGHAVASATRVIAPRVSSLAMLPPVDVCTYPHQDRCEAHERVRCASCVAFVSVRSGGQAVSDLLMLRERARRALGLTTQVRALPGSCQRRGCGRRELRQDNGSDTVYCAACNHRMTRDDYERYANVFLVEA